MKKYKTVKETETQTDKPYDALVTSGSNKQAWGGSSGRLQIITRITQGLSCWQIPEMTCNMPVYKSLYRSRVLFASPSLTRTTFPFSLRPNPWQNYSKQPWQAGNTFVDVEYFLKGTKQATCQPFTNWSCLNILCIKLHQWCFFLGTWMNDDYLNQHGSWRSPLYW